VILNVILKSYCFLFKCSIKYHFLSPFSLSSQVILDYLFFDYDLQKAVNEPRVHNQLSPSETFVEENIDEVRFLHLATKV